MHAGGNDPAATNHIIWTSMMTLSPRMTVRQAATLATAQPCGGLFEGHVEGYVPHGWCHDLGGLCVGRATGQIPAVGTVQPCASHHVRLHGFTALTTVNFAKRGTLLGSGIVGLSSIMSTMTMVAFF